MTQPTTETILSDNIELERSSIPGLVAHHLHLASVLFETLSDEQQEELTEELTKAFAGKALLWFSPAYDWYCSMARSYAELSEALDAE